MAIVVTVLAASSALSGCATRSDAGGSGGGFNRTADACNHLRKAVSAYAASSASASDFDTYVAALGYAVEGVQGSDDAALVAAANRMDRAAQSNSYDGIATALQPFVLACSGH